MVMEGLRYEYEKKTAHAIADAFDEITGDLEQIMRVLKEDDCEKEEVTEMVEELIRKIGYGGYIA